MSERKMKVIKVGELETRERQKKYEERLMNMCSVLEREVEDVEEKWEKFKSVYLKVQRGCVEL